VYLKPHAKGLQVERFLRDYFFRKDLKVTLEGSLGGKDMQSGGVIDKQYGDIARRAMLLKPEELSLSSASFIRFQKKFGVSWSDALEDDLLYNTSDATENLQVTGEILGQAWMESMSSGKVVKLGRGFYCGLIDTIPDKPALFCINGFFMAMRAEYLAANASVHYFLVEWDNGAMSWEDFRKKVIGVTNPSLAHPESLRSIMTQKWDELGLSGPLDTMSNGLHASASAFEAMVERSIWLGVPLHKDKQFGVDLFSTSIPAAVIEGWATNPRIRGKFVFDHMENQGSGQCLETAKALHRNTSSGTELTLSVWIIVHISCLSPASAHLVSCFTLF
jgi:hypothetical protein